MPFGLCNAPATFERLMERVMAGLQWEILLLYIDDILCFGRTIQEALGRLEVVFQRLRAANLKLKPRKCHLLKPQVQYLGHVVSANGISTDPQKIEVVKTWKRPETVTEVRSFLGLASYYRRFIQGFASIAGPLHRLTEKNRPFVWTDECEKAFVDLRERLTTAPILSYPLPDCQFILDTDASGFALGAVLSQVQNSQEKVVAYASRNLSKPEKNYCVTRRELLAVIFALKHFKPYIYGRAITLRTDHGALRWLTNFKDPEGQLARWLEMISQYDITLLHRPGRQHGNADGLSRKCNQCGRDEPDKQSAMELPSLADVAGQAEVPQPQNAEVAAVKSEKKRKTGNVSVMIETDTGITKDGVHKKCGQVRNIAFDAEITKADIRQAQLAEPTLGKLLKMKEQQVNKPTWHEIAAMSSEFKTYWSQWTQLEIRDGMLCRKWESDDGKQITYKVIMPSKFRQVILKELHDSKTAAHLGVRKTKEKIQERYYWVGLSKDVRSFIRKCCKCTRRKSPREKRSPLQQYPVGAPMERIALDILGPLPTSDRGNNYILVVGDYFTKWVEAYALPNQRAEVIAKTVVEQFVCRFGVPREMHSDQGRNFESKVMAEVCQLLGIHKTRTTPYNPKSDGFIERFHKTLMNMVATLIDPSKSQRDWDEQLPYAMCAYRSSVQESIRDTPNMMMLGRNIELPVDLTCEKPEGRTSPLDTDYAEELRKRLCLAHEKARGNLKLAAEHQRRNYDRKSKPNKVKEGMLVWMHNVAVKKGQSPKLALPWEGPFKVVKQLTDVVFRIKKGKHGKFAVVHADRLKPYEGPPVREMTKRNRQKLEGPIRKNPVRERKLPKRFTCE